MRDFNKPREGMLDSYVDRFMRSEVTESGNGHSSVELIYLLRIADLNKNGRYCRSLYLHRVSVLSLSSFLCFFFLPLILVKVNVNIFVLLCLFLYQSSY
jgi:hypothetical protein